MAKNCRVIIIGLDGATWDIISHLIGKGRLPNFKKLTQEGSWGVLESLEIPMSSASWTTITTGVRPEKHGIFDFSARKKDSYDIRPLSSKDVKYPRVWDILGKDEKISYVVNVPMTYPPKKINGAMISGFPSPEHKNDFAYPIEFIEELRNKIDTDIHFQPRVGPHQEKEFLKEMMTITDYVEKTTNYILKEKEFDFLMSVFVDPDAIGHTFFKYLDEKHPRYVWHEEFSHAIYDVYVRFDKSLGTIIDNLKDNDKLFIVSDHGFAPVYYGVALNKWLMEKGYLVMKKDLSTLLKMSLFNAGLTYENLFKIAIKFNLVKMAQDEVYDEKESIIKKILNKIMIGWNDIDWNETQAYSQGNFGQIFVNLRGREPQGNVEIGEYGDIVDAILSDLKDFTHKDEKVFDTIKRGKDIYGNYIGPDIICLHSKSKYIVSRFFEFGSNNTVTVHPMWNGAHDKHGIFVAWDNGKDIVHKERLLANVEDITPTIIRLYDFEIFNGYQTTMDGKFLEEIFNNDIKEKLKNKFKKRMTLRSSTKNLIIKLKINGVIR